MTEEVLALMHGDLRMKIVERHGDFLLLVRATDGMPVAVNLNRIIALRPAGDRSTPRGMMSNTELILDNGESEIVAGLISEILRGCTL